MGQELSGCLLAVGMRLPPARLDVRSAAGLNVLDGDSGVIQIERVVVRESSKIYPQLQAYAFTGSGSR